MSLISDMPGNFEQAATALRLGELVVFPTETFYGIATDPMNAAALERIFALKGREPDKPIALIAADAVAAFRLANDVPVSARRLADAFWPGPLTLVVPARDGLHSGLIGPDGGIGVRVSPHPVASALVRAVGGLITATSANLAGQPPARTVAEARASLGDRIAVYLNGGTLGAAAASTVVGFAPGGALRILREGPITYSSIKTVLERSE